MGKFFQPKGMKEGIYFNLPNEAYHEDPALSHSGMTLLLVSWQDYWVKSIHNPERSKYKPTDAMITGTRTGELLLEGDHFYRKYSTKHSVTHAHGGIPISSYEYGRLREAVDGILDVPIGKEYFTNGYPEVSIFWIDEATGVMLRARIDYLRIFGAIDFKRIMGVDNWTIGKAVKNQGLDIQNWLYLEAIKAARRMLKRMGEAKRRAFSEENRLDPEWIEAFTFDEDLWFRFVFQRSTPPYIWEIRDLDPEVLEEGERATRAAILRYRKGIETFGLAKPPLSTGATKSISSFHIPRRDYDYQEN